MSLWGWGTAELHFSRAFVLCAWMISPGGAEGQWATAELHTPLHLLSGVMYMTCVACMCRDVWILCSFTSQHLTSSCSCGTACAQPLTVSWCRWHLKPCLAALMTRVCNWQVSHAGSCLSVWCLFAVGCFLPAVPWCFNRCGLLVLTRVAWFARCAWQLQTEQSKL
jgi:hypothetical protein